MGEWRCFNAQWRQRQRWRLWVQQGEAGVDAFAAGRHKFEYEWLRVTDKNGNEFLVWTPPNGGCLILWNVLLMLIGMQKDVKAG